MTVRNKKVLAVVPAYNEEGNIVSAVADLQENAPFADYVIIDDGSIDGTARICRERGYNVVSHAVNLGLAAAVQTGMLYALRNGYDYVVQFDADGQHSAAYIRDMVELADSNGCDIVIGSRFQDEKKPVSARMAGSLLITFMIRLTTGFKLNDPTSGMRLFGKRAIQLFATELNFSPEPDTIAHLIRNGFSVCETQVDMRDRLTGESYLNISRSVSYMMRVFVSIMLVQWFRKKV